MKEAIVAHSKDRGAAKTKKPAQKGIKEKRQNKKAKKAASKQQFSS